MFEDARAALSAAYGLVEDRLIRHDYRTGPGKKARKKKKAARRREKQGRRNSRR
jgi:hypothetical protein